MNVCGTVQAKKKEFSLYVHNLQNVKQWDKECLPRLITRENIKGTTHDLCHLPTYQCQEEFAVKFNIQLREEHILLPGSACLSPPLGGGNVHMIPLCRIES